MLSLQFAKLLIDYGLTPLFVSKGRGSPSHPGRRKDDEPRRKNRGKETCH